MLLRSQLGLVGNSIIMSVRVGAVLAAMLLGGAAQAASMHTSGSGRARVSASALHGQASAESLSEAQSGTVGTLLRWVSSSRDNDGLPFIVVDKLGARVFVFDADATLLGSAPVLVGIGRGDDSAPGVGTKRMGKIPVEQRTTPAGRFIARFGPAKGHPPVLWIDYGDAISLHPVVTANKKERRLQRIKSADADDHRISFGCVNVPASFYAKIVKPQFKSKNSRGVVYVLPDTKALTDVFPGIVLQAPTVSAAANEN